MTAAQSEPITFRLNGDDRICAVAPTTRLSELLHEHFGLTATKTACDIGRCGACTVLVGDLPVNACLVMAWQIDGADVVTAEGLDRYEEARILKDALAAENAFQCGYCAPGVTMALTALLRVKPSVSERDIRSALEGNICRCTGYHSIIRGALAAVEAIAEKRGPAERSH